eukprot:GHVQ01014655.1.p1 GENE.GHVQ01014655.1~~GHVQ01014655.1.p1  ORF type:complete len:234 (-),score=28.92 GHVQ01014655.1:373-1074(-)
MSKPVTELSHWQEVYRREQQEGGEEEWFTSESKSILKLILEEYGNVPSVLDVGCGNGLFLINLSQTGKTGRLKGIDYVQEAICLAKRLSAEQGVCVEFEVADLSKPEAFIGGSEWFALVHDKGTFDIFYMTGSVSKYVAAITKFMKPGYSRLCITSCNTTEEELKTIFLSGSYAGTQDNCVAGQHDRLSCGSFVFERALRHKEFKFGGVVGQTVATVVFRFPKDTEKQHLFAL